MFNSLNDEIKRTTGTQETPRSRLLLYASAVAGALFAMWALYAGILLLE